MKLLQGTIVITNFPFSDQTGSKVRPALIVSSSAFNRNSSDVWVTGVSTKENSEEYKISLNQSDLTEGYLLKSSFIKFTSIIHVEKQLLQKRVGQVKSQKMHEVLKSMQKILEED